MRGITNSNKNEVFCQCLSKTDAFKENCNWQPELPERAQRYRVSWQSSFAGGTPRDAPCSLCNSFGCRECIEASESQTHDRGFLHASKSSASGLPSSGFWSYSHLQRRKTPDLRPGYWSYALIIAGRRSCFHAGASITSDDYIRPPGFQSKASGIERGLRAFLLTRAVTVHMQTSTWSSTGRNGAVPRGFLGCGARTVLRGAAT